MIPPGKSTAPTRILAGWLLNGKGDPAQRNVVLRLHRGRIVSLEPAQAPQTPSPQTLDLTRCTLLPGLVDAHVHLFMSGTPDPDARRNQLGSSYKEAAPTMEARLRAHLAFGVVAVRDGGDRAGHAMRYKAERRSHVDVPVSIRVAGHAWHAPGRYGRLIGRSPTQGEDLADSLARERPRPDHVKIVNSGLNSLLAFGHPTRPQFQPHTLAHAVQKAKAMGLRTMVHANGADAVRQSMEAGCDSIEHGFFMGYETLNFMAERGTFWVPTACTMSGYASTLPNGRREVQGAMRNLEHQITQISRAIGTGVRVALGTDSGSQGVHHGRAVAEELQLFLQAGMTIEQAVQCATWNGALLLGLENRLGRLDAGRPATFVVAEGGPERLPKSLNPPAAVFVDGISQGNAGPPQSRFSTR